MPAIDADAVVALMMATHPHHAEARRQFEAAGEILLHPSVITEFTTVLRRQANRNRADGNQVAREALRTLLTQPRVQIEANIPYDRVTRRYLASPELSFTDAIVAEFAHHFDKAKPITFDQNLLRNLETP